MRPVSHSPLVQLARERRKVTLHRGRRVVTLVGVSPKGERVRLEDEHGKRWTCHLREIAHIHQP